MKITKNTPNINSNDRARSNNSGKKTQKKPGSPIDFQPLINSLKEAEKQAKDEFKALLSNKYYNVTGINSFREPTAGEREFLVEIAEKIKGKLSAKRKRKIQQEPVLFVFANGDLTGKISGHRFTGATIGEKFKGNSLIVIRTEHKQADYSADKGKTFPKEIFAHEVTHVLQLRGYIPFRRKPGKNQIDDRNYRPELAAGLKPKDLTHEDQAEYVEHELLHLLTD